MAGPNGFAHGVDLFQYIIDFAESNIKKVTAVTGNPISHMVVRILIIDDYFAGIQFPNLKFFVRNCFLPAVDEVKYDRIHVGACCPEGYLNYLYDLLKPEGILVVRTDVSKMTPVKKSVTRMSPLFIAIIFADSVWWSVNESCQKQRRNIHDNISAASQILGPYSAL